MPQEISDKNVEDQFKMQEEISEKNVEDPFNSGIIINNKDKENLKKKEEILNNNSEMTKFISDLLTKTFSDRSLLIKEIKKMTTSLGFEVFVPQ